MLHESTSLLLTGCCAAALLLLCSQAHATIHHVDGSLSADCPGGSYSVAARSCSGSDGDAFDTLAEALSALGTSDDVVIRSGRGANGSAAEQADGRCGCRMAPEPRSGRWLMASVLVLLGLGRRHRRLCVGHAPNAHRMARLRRRMSHCDGAGRTATPRLLWRDGFVLTALLVCMTAAGCGSEQPPGAETGSGASGATGATGGGSGGGGGAGAGAPGGGGGAGAGELLRLRVPPGGGHHLETEDGQDFFWLGNMPWLPETISMADMEMYLDARQAQGFNFVSIAAHNFESPLYSGELPFDDHGPVVLNEAYWSFIDWMIDQAAARGIYVALAAMWGFDADTMFSDPYQHNYDYGKLLGQRYGDRRNVVLVVAGEFSTIKCPNRGYCAFQGGLTVGDKELLRRIADGFRAGAATDDPEGKILITVHGMTTHPEEQVGATFHHDDWLDFYLEQTWQYADYINDIFPYDWQLDSPTKPAIQGETGYWERTVDPETPHDAWAMRYQAYWSVFHGSAGFTYGSYFWENIPGDFDLEGAWDMRHLEDLILSRPLGDYLPDQSLITPDTAGSDYVGEPHAWDASLPDLRCSTRASDGRWALAYTTKGKQIGIYMDGLATGLADAYWYDPRTGRWHDGQNESDSKSPFMSGIPSGAGAAVVYFDPPGDPGEDADWVLELEVK